MQKDYGLYGKRMQIDRESISHVTWSARMRSCLEWKRIGEWGSFPFCFSREKPKEYLQYIVSSSLVPVGLVLRDLVHSFLVHTRSSYVSQSLFLPYLLSLLASSNNRMTNIIKALRQCCVCLGKSRYSSKNQPMEIKQQIMMCINILYNIHTPRKSLTFLGCSSSLSSSHVTQELQVLYCIGKLFFGILVP